MKIIAVLKRLYAGSVWHLRIEDKDAYLEFYPHPTCPVARKIFEGLKIDMESTGEFPITIEFKREHDTNND